MATTPPPPPPARSWGRSFLSWTATAVVLLLLFGGIVFLENTPGETLEDCTIISTEVRSGHRRTPPGVRVESSCGVHFSRLIAHSSMLKVGRTYTLELSGGILSPERITRVKDSSPLGWLH